ncbi:hypothetical protein LPJ63_002649 [Coemansia sp. RSA 2711]|nr:hypothetical protein LPJ63_002649 [Coemansia sp. RSA 2711]KAJ2365975.1 hypothetical protein H4S01_002963 [Coemansia sp. RSA 2610]KAJ2726015.1 hypothetical protein H4R23_004079 [Coemansia sp. Cherry 401B]
MLLGARCAGRPLAGSPDAAKATAPALCDPSVQQYSGYMDIAPDKHLFYWFFEARNQRQPRHLTPLVLWLNGGPGCSSLSGLLSGVGPCHVGSDSNSTTTNPYSWNTNVNILFLDQPTNTGYSYGANVSTTRNAARDVVTFLRRFYTQYPQYSLSELHVMGESYAAHYVPGIASQIVRENRWARSRRLPLASIAVGNGLFDMELQYQYLPEMACASEYPPIVNATTCSAMASARNEFRRLLALNPGVQRDAAAAANATFAGYDILTPYQLAGGNPYDVRKLCGSGSLCDDYMDRIAAFASQPWVRAALGTRDGPEFRLCNPDVQDAFIGAGDEMVDASMWIPEVLAAGVRVLNYAGDADLICGWVGNKALMLRLPWPGQAGFNMAADRAWAAGGQVRAFGGLTFLRVNGAGHMVAKDQPAAALAMLSQWLDYRAIV